jgi:DNA-binding MarR family transcriptional regulator
MNASAAQEELKKRHPFSSPKVEAFINILLTSDQFEHRLARLLRDFDLTPSQYNVLRILRGEGKPLPCLEVATRMIQQVPAITGLVDRLEKQGLVERERCSEDRRVVYVSITREALALIKKVDNPLAALHEALLGHLTERDLQQLIRLLEKARAGASLKKDR